MGQTTYDQKGFRVRNDDGSETSATWVDAVNVDASFLVDTNLRLRFIVAVSSKDASNQTYTLEVNKNGSGWAFVTGTTINARSTLSPNFAEDEATTQQIGLGTFNAGKMDEVDGSLVSSILAGAETEHEFCVQIRSADVVVGDKLAFRLTRNGGLFDTYTATPTITAAEPYTLELNAYRWYNDDGTEATATTFEAQDTAATIAPAADVIKHLRSRIDETAGGTGVVVDTLKLQYRKNVGTWGDVGIETANVRVPVTVTGLGDLTTAVYTGLSASVSSEETLPSGLFFKPDGTAMYVLGRDADTVFQYSLSVAWDTSTALYSGKSFTEDQQGVPTGLFFKPDGTKFYIVGDDDTVFQYDMGTAWDVSTASYNSIFFSVTSQTSTTRDLFFKPDGTSLYALDGASDAVYQYDLSTAWDLSTATYTNKSFSVISEAGTPFGLFFGNNGTVFYFVGNSNTTVYQYDLGTAWDLSTATYANKSFSVLSEDSDPRGLFVRSDGTGMYIAGANSGTVYQYDLGTVTPRSSLTEAGDTTNRADLTDPASGLFVAGRQKATNAAITNYALTASNFTEHVFALEFVAADLAASDSLEFRLLFNGEVTTSGSVPTVTISSGTIKNIYDGANLIEDVYEGNTKLSQVAIGDVIVWKKII